VDDATLKIDREFQQEENPLVESLTDLSRSQSLGRVSQMSPTLDPDSDSDSQTMADV